MSGPLPTDPPDDGLSFEEPLGRPAPRASTPQAPHDPDAAVGTVATVIPVVPNGNATLVIEVRSDDGTTTAVRKLFAFPLGAPHVSPGHRVIVHGRRRSGYLVPHTIENLTTGVVWTARRTNGITWTILGLFLAIVIAFIISFTVVSSRATHVFDEIDDLRSSGPVPGTSAVQEWT